MKKIKSKLNKTSIISIALTVIILTIAVIIIINRNKDTFDYNPEGVVGNTTGNLYNGGYFCELDGKVYFSNPYDNNFLYVMDLDGYGIHRVYKDTVSCINAYGDYLFYKRENDETKLDEIFHGSLYGVFRYDIESAKLTELYRGRINNLMMYGNYLYYQSYSDDGDIQISSIKINKTDRKVLFNQAYNIACAFKGKLYYTQEEKNHYLYSMDTESNREELFMVGNYYLPDTDGQYVYYIDLKNNRALCRVNLETMNISIIADENVVNYNLSANKDVIYYQSEKEGAHALKRMNTDGTRKVVVYEGDYSNIHITSIYTYFYMTIGGENMIYRTPTYGAADVQIWQPTIE